MSMDSDQMILLQESVVQPFNSAMKWTWTKIFPPPWNVWVLERELILNTALDTLHEDKCCEGILCRIFNMIVAMAIVVRAGRAHRVVVHLAKPVLYRITNRHIQTMGSMITLANIEPRPHRGNPILLAKASRHYVLCAIPMKSSSKLINHLLHDWKEPIFDVMPT